TALLRPPASCPLRRPGRRPPGPLAPARSWGPAPRPRPVPLRPSPGRWYPGTAGGAGKGGSPVAAERVVATNRKAHHDYFILERYEAGIVLQGTEVKSLRAGRANLREAFAKVENGEVILDRKSVV